MVSTGRRSTGEEMPLFYYDKELYIYLKWMLVLALLCHITRTLLSEILKVSQSKWAAGSGKWAANLVWQCFLYWSS